MKQFTQPFSIITVFALGLILWAGCSKEYVPEETTRSLQLKFGLNEYADVEVRSPGTPAEDYVQALDVIFFNTATGAKATLRDGADPYFFYNVATPNNAQWKDNDPTNHTAIIPMAPVEAIGTTVVVIANLKSEIRARLRRGAADEITTLAQLKTIFTSQNAVEDVASPFTMIAQHAITTTEIPNVRQDHTINALLERVIAKVTVHLYYDWKKLVPNHATARGRYMFKDFDARTYLYKENDISNPRVHSSIKVLPKTSRPAPTFQETTIEAYINEYALQTNQGEPFAPYILLDLPAVIGEEFNASTGGMFPPPAGDGETYDNTPVRNFYKIVMPREIKRNHSYQIYATIMNHGGATPEAAAPVPFSLTVLNWEESVVYVHPAGTQGWSLDRFEP